MSAVTAGVKHRTPSTFPLTTAGYFTMSANGAPTTSFADAAPRIVGTEPTSLSHTVGEAEVSLAGGRSATVRYETFGDPRNPAVVTLGGITATAHATTIAGAQPAAAQPQSPGWWSDQVGLGKAIDLRDWFVIGMDWVTPSGDVSTADQATALAQVLSQLGIATVAHIVGASYGAMVAAAFAQAYPSRCEHITLISGGCDPHPFGRAWRRLQREIVALVDDSRKAEALSVARQLALLSYRTPADFAAHARTENGTYDYAATDSWLRDCGETFAGKYDEATFTALSASIDAHTAVPEEITVPCTVIAVAQDLLVDPADLLTFSQRMPKGDYHLISSAYGHDAFLKEPEQISRLLTTILRTDCC